MRWLRLVGIADAFLVGERPIARRVDDSVVRAGALRPDDPAPLARLRPGRRRHAARRRRPILAVGADLKNTITLVVDGQALSASTSAISSTTTPRSAFAQTIRRSARRCTRSTGGTLLVGARRASGVRRRRPSRTSCLPGRRAGGAASSRARRVRAGRARGAATAAWSASASTAPAMATTDDLGRRVLRRAASRRASSASRTCGRALCPAAMRRRVIRCRPRPDSSPSSTACPISTAAPFRFPARYRQPLELLPKQRPRRSRRRRWAGSSTPPPRCSASPARSPSKGRRRSGSNSWPGRRAEQRGALPVSAHREAARLPTAAAGRRPGSPGRRDAAEIARAFHAASRAASPIRPRGSASAATSTPSSARAASFRTSCCSPP